MTRGQRAALVMGSAGLTLALALSIHSGHAATLGLGDALLVSSFSLLSLRLLTTALLRGMPSVALGVRTTLLTGLLKLPILLLGIFCATRLPDPGLGFFLAGVGLVYSTFVWFTACSG